MRSLWTDDRIETPSSPDEVAQVRAADVVVTQFGIKRGVIDLGGNLRLLPKPPPGRDAYRVGIRNPTKKSELLNDVLELCNVSLSTSGDYERFVKLGESHYGHIMNPRTGQPTQYSGSVTVIAPSAMLADWLSTSIFLQGRELAKQAETSFSGVSVIITDEVGRGR